MARQRRSRRRLTEAERAEKRAEDRRRMEAAIEELRSGEGRRRWLEVRRHSHTYSWRNQLLIAHQRPGATRVASFGRWLRLGYAVRRGERGIRVWKYCDPSRKAIERWRAAGADPAIEPEGFFIMVPVFDRSQVEPRPDLDGERVELDPPIVPVDGDSLAGLIDPLVAFAASIGLRVDFVPIPGSAAGSFNTVTKEITVDGATPNARVKTLLHELSHALVRCDRTEDDPDLGYAEEEAVVECVAFGVCSAVGFDTSGYSVPYVAGWGAGGEIERYAALIDRLARRLECVVLDDARPAGEEDEGEEVVVA
jgi:N-terminal domain of anti-restriction factor ArdC